MRKKLFLILCLVTFLVTLIFSNILEVSANEWNPGIITAKCLKHGMKWNNYTVVDIRSAEEYSIGHIKGSVNIPFEVPYSTWITMKDDLLLEVPDYNELKSALGNYGINKNSKIIIVTSTSQYPFYPLANATRVAITLKYMGVDKISILDGGFDKWVQAGYLVNTDLPVAKPTIFRGNRKSGMFVSIDYVNKKIGSNKSIIVDTRADSVYSGEVIEPYAEKAGHIPSAVSLPTPIIWNDDGTYKSREELCNVARNVLGRDKHKEIILYCGVGGYASSWYFVLTEVLDYKNVKIYDGSAQEWVRYYDMEL